MDRKKEYIIAIGVFAAVAIVGMVYLGSYWSGIFETPSTSSDNLDLQEGDDKYFDANENPLLTGSRDPGFESKSSEEIGTKNGDQAWYLYLGIAGTVLACIGLVAISGRAYMESSRHENLVRNDLVDLISINPGINLTSIRNELQLSQGAVSYHLRRLEKGGVIYSQKGLKERRYYSATMGYRNVEDRSAQDELRNILSNPTTQSIVETLKKGDMTQNQIVNEVGITPSTVHWHMERLGKAGVVEKRREGRTVVYTLNTISVET